MSARGPLYRFLTDDGLIADGTNQDMTGTTDKYYIGPPEGEYWVLHRAIVYIEDNGNMTVATYGTQSVLSSGCKFYTTSGGANGTVNVDLLGGLTLKNNGGWAGVCYDMDIKTALGGGNDICVARYTFGKSGVPLILSGATEDKIVFHVQDDLTSIIAHTIKIQGYDILSLSGVEH